MVTGMASHALFNPGTDAIVVDEAGHQVDPGHFTGDPDDPVTASLIAAHRVLDQGPIGKKGS